MNAPIAIRPIEHRLKIHLGMWQNIPPLIEQLVTKSTIALVCEAYGIDEHELLSYRRKAILVHSRALAVWLLRTCEPAFSYPTIGRHLGGRHHTTIINLHRMAIRLRLEDLQFAALCATFTGDALSPQNGGRAHG
ncbi:hypothetical protein D2V17_14330 [Aurantiacibacter xanthus]|uniref:Chromosomal replication initiator DnaA C-terminal domain-containing protein n=1 Tax=Aurantiacibacter xanthus TaxID=1784712 RepID=A0A3A1P3V2_9SPHN|nr:helix-turn-helix domain-containing protein [Aurantiacibacter xanthus]RIV82975.1 hypothetical protein D2V17_14330 [Aurantiacibacter xanthus]